MYSELLPPLLQRLLGVSPLEFDSDRNTQLSALLVSFYEASFEPADPNADDAAADRARRRPANATPLRPSGAFENVGRRCDRRAP